jgi:hypothetical protein
MQRAHATRFMNTIKTFSGSSDIEELEHYGDCLQVLQNLIVLDEAINDLQDDVECGRCGQIRGIGGRCEANSL